ncbi:M1 family metallopeptidase, partial [Saprospiraceae bacterium]|nr:M1 family metallopeptidase [Saprospiraceae bacterium]
QWFPKPAVFDKDGWHPMPYLTQGEFYSEFGSYDVTLTLPENYVVCATGTLKTDSEYQFLQEKIEETKERAQDTIRDTTFPESSSKMKTIRYTAENVHDFGWFADKRFYVEKGNVSLSNGANIDTWVFYTDTEKTLWQDALSYVDRSVKFYSDMVGNYPYPQATAVQSALSAGGGMEYPMITVIGAMGNAKALDGVITHEVGHNWFYGILGFNERDHAWLDEGINSYYDHRYTQQYYKESSSMGLPAFLTKGMELSGMQLALAAQTKRGHDQAPSLHSADFESTNYFFSCYEKPALAFEFLEQYLGAERFDKIMHSLYDQWEFKHPGPDDVISHFNKEAGEDLSWFFDGFIYSNDEVDYKVKSIKKSGDLLQIKVVNKGDINAPFPVTAYKDGKAVETKWYEATDKSKVYDFPMGNYDYFMIDSSYTMLDINQFNNYKKTKGVNLPSIGLLGGVDNMKKKQIFVLPAISYNAYDGFMLGLNLNNYAIPFPRFKGSITSMYGFGSKLIAGTARLQYDHAIKKGKLQRISYKLSSRQFSLDQVTDDGQNRNYGTVVPSVKFHFMHDNNSPWTSIAEIKSTFARISGISNILDLTDVDDNVFTEVNYKVFKTHPLTPFQLEASIEHMSYRSFFATDGGDSQQNAVKLDLAVKQSYEFMKGKSFSVRGYVAAMPINSGLSTTLVNETRAGANANINLVANGFSDHSYEDFYFGRNEQEGFFSSQVHMRDGAFKLGGIDPGGIGQSDRFAYAVNIVTDLPIKKLPSFVKLYFDYGGYMINRQSSSERAMEQIYSGGVMLNFVDIVSVHFPLINSSTITQIQGSAYLPKITFTLDLGKADVVDLYNNFRI